MRIISGKYKGRRFSPPKNLKVRPTTDFAKENLFNILNNYIFWEDTDALDLFGGTGSISLELVSRGCPRVICVEESAAQIAFIEHTKATLGITEMRTFKFDAFKYLTRCTDTFDFIFADPPYNLPNFEDVPRLILEKDLIKEGGTFVLEHSKEYDFSELPLFREKRVYGNVNFSIFENKKEVE